MLYNLHTQKNKWNNLANANIKIMKLDKALSIRVQQLIITNCTVADEFIKKRAKSICKYCALLVHYMF